MSIKKTQASVTPHTEAKLNFYIEYLKGYLPVLLNTPFISEINIYDVFCGEGIYKDDKKGSAIRAFEIIKDIAPDYLSKKITLNLNDINANKTKKIQDYIQKEQQKSENFKIGYSSKDASELMKKLAKNFEQQDRCIKNLVFIDPYGYKEVLHRDLFTNLLKNNHTEIIIFIPIDHLNRFRNEQVTVETFQSFGIEPYNISDSEDMIRKFKEAFNFNDKYFSASFFIKTAKSRYYSVFFITSHIYGLQKILEVKWKLDRDTGKGFFGGLRPLFSNELDNLKERLKNYLKNQKNNNEIYKFVLLENCLPKHANEILKKWQNENKLEIESTNTRKGSFYLNHENYKERNIKIEIKLKND